MSGAVAAPPPLYLRDHLLARPESANVLADPVRATLTSMVVGAGYAGVELTAQMARLTAGQHQQRHCTEVRLTDGTTQDCRTVV